MNKDSIPEPEQNVNTGSIPEPEQMQDSIPESDQDSSGTESDNSKRETSIKGGEKASPCKVF